MFIFYVHDTMSFLGTNFLETDTMFLEFIDDLDNLMGGLSSVGDNPSEANNGILT